MQMKKIIINADDFGYSKDNNEAVKQGFLSGFITSASIMTNMQGFDDAVNILKEIPNIDLGFHFNIMEGKSITKCSLLCGKDGYFNQSYIDLILKSHNKAFMQEIEQEVKAQLEKTLKYHKISHIDSHIHTHAIPNIFKLTVKLAKEYNINFIRTQKEIPYIVFEKSYNLKYPVNMIKNILLDYYTKINKKELSIQKINSNDYFIGILYTGNMDEKAIIEGIKKIKKDNTITEIIFHPSLDKNKLNNYREFLITQNPKLKENLINVGFEFCNYTLIN